MVGTGKTNRFNGIRQAQKLNDWIMKKITLVLMALLIIHLSVAQESRESLWKITVKMKTGDKQVGFLKSVDSTSIGLITASKKALKSEVNNFETINVRDIEVIKIKEKGAAGRAARNGAIIGAGIGVLAGVISGEEFFASQGEVILRNGLVVGAAGALTGLMIGGLSGGKKYLLEGSLKNYQLISEELETYALK